jgi:hypothetical protein
LLSWANARIILFTDASGTCAAARSKSFFFSRNMRRTMFIFSMSIGEFPIAFVVVIVLDFIDKDIINNRPITLPIKHSRYFYTYKFKRLFRIKIHLPEK